MSFRKLFKFGKSQEFLIQKIVIIYDIIYLSILCNFSNGVFKRTISVLLGIIAIRHYLWVQMLQWCQENLNGIQYCIVFSY